MAAAALPILAASTLASTGYGIYTGVKAKEEADSAKKKQDADNAQLLQNAVDQRTKLQAQSAMGSALAALSGGGNGAGRGSTFLTGPLGIVPQTGNGGKTLLGL